MSQAGDIDILGTNPDIPTEFITDAGTAVPILNQLEILGTTVAAGSTPFEFTGAGNVVTGEIQLSQAIAGTDATKVGLSAFDSSDFSVDVNGFVTLAAAGVAQTLTGDSGGAISPVANNINTLGSGSITIAGAGNTLTTQLTGLTDHAVLVGAGTSTITKLAIGATGQVLTGVTGADPVWASPAASTITLTGTTGGALGPSNTFTLLGGTVAAGTVPVAIAGAATTLTTNIQISQALAASDATKIGLSNFNSAQFSVDANGFVSASTTGLLQTLTGNSGVATPVANNINVVTANATVKFVGSGATLTQDFGLNNLVLGSSLPALTSGDFSVGLGNGVLAALTSGANNTAIGYQALTANQSANNNTAIGWKSLTACTGAANTAVGLQSLLKVTSGQNNTGLGLSSGANILTGTDNICIGVSSALSLIAAESSNIIVGNSGTLGDGNTIRLGTQGSGTGQQNKCFIAGIAGVTNSNNTLVTQNSSTAQLGATTATFPNTTTSQQILYSTADNVIGQLTTANSKFPATNSAGTLAMRALSVVIQTFVANGTYTPTAGMVYCVVEMVGPGGGGGGVAACTAAQGAQAGAGGAGEYARGVFSAATIGASQAVTCPAGGAGGAAGANNGTAGADTTALGALMTVFGGKGGAGAAASAAGQTTAGGAGGTGGSGGSFRCRGQPGGNSTGAFGTFSMMGNGGSSPWGGGALGLVAGAAGTAASGNGAGGGGALGFNSAARAGGNGSASMIVVTEYVIA